MNNSGQQRVKQEASKVSKQTACRHGFNHEDCKFCNHPQIPFDFNDNFKQVIIRANMFSPSNCIKNIREVRKQAAKNQNKYNEVAHKKLSVSELSDNMSDAAILDPEQLQIMMKVHQKLINRASKLVEKAKKSQFGGFFSPRRLRNRIKIGNFSQLPGSPIVVRQQQFSPCNNAARSNKINGRIMAKFESKNTTSASSPSANMTCDRVYFKSDEILNTIKSGERSHNVKHVQMKYHKIANKEMSPLDEDYKLVQQKIRSIFSL